MSSWIPKRLRRHSKSDTSNWWDEWTSIFDKHTDRLSPQLESLAQFSQALEDFDSIDQNEMFDHVEEAYSAARSLESELSSLKNEAARAIKDLESADGRKTRKARKPKKESKYDQASAVGLEIAAAAEDLKTAAEDLIELASDATNLSEDFDGSMMQGYIDDATTQLRNITKLQRTMQKLFDEALAEDEAGSSSD